MFLFKGTTTLMWLDFVIIAILLVGVFIGIKKGFIDQLFSLVGIFATIIGAILLCKLVANNFMASDSGAIFNKMQEFTANKLGEWEYYESTKVVWSDVETNAGLINQALTLLGLPAIIANLGLFNGMFKGFSAEPATLASQLPQTLTLYVNYAISFVILFIILSIAILILKKTLKKLASLPLIAPIDKLLGIIFAVIKNLITIIAVFVVATFISSFITPIGDFINNVAYEQSWFGQKLIKPIVEWIMSIIVK